MRAPRRPPLSLDEYLRHTREGHFNVLMVVLLLAVYEGGLILSGELRRNAADVLLKGWLGSLGEDAVLLFHVFLFALATAAGAAYWRRGGSPLRYVVPFLLEAVLWAGLLAPVILWVGAPFLARPGGGDLLLDVGAGVYEELVFRYLLIRGPFLLLHLDPWRVFGLEGAPRSREMARLAMPVGAIVLFSSLAFAAYHHIGVGGEAWDLGAFLFRLLAGLLLAALSFWRGLAMAVYVHAAYDVFVGLLSA